MDTNNWRPAPADGGRGESVTDAGDWRSQLQPNSRQRIVNAIMGTLKRCVPFSGQEGLQELKKIAERFEEKICTFATSQPDYLEKVSLKMLSIEMKSPNTMTNSLPSNSRNNYKSSESPPDTASSDSTAQTGNATNEDWQGEIYQKIRVMKEAYLPELIGVDQKIAGKLQQHESLPQQPKNKQLEKLKFSKIMLEGILQFLQVPKSRILPNFKDKVSAYEKHIANFLNSSRPQRLASLQQGQGQQILPPHIGQSMEQSQQSQSHITQALPMHENHMNPQLQSMNVQGSSVATVQQNNVASLQYNSLSALSGVSTTSQSRISSLQAGSTIDLGQASALSALQEVPAGSLQQNHVNDSQQANINSLSLHCGMNVLQQNLTPVQSSSNMLQNLHLKQQEQQMLQTQQKHQFQQCHMQQQQRHLLDQPNEQQQNVLQPPQKPQLHQINDANDWKMRQQVGTKTGVFQRHYSVDQWSEYHHQQLKSGAQFPLSSSELLQPMSPLMPQHPAPQIDEQNLPTPTFLAKAGTPLQSTSLPFVVPFPSTPIAPSPISVESEKVNSGVSALLDARKIGYEQAAGALTRDQLLSIGTAGIPASPLVEEFICPDGNHGNASPVVSGKSSVTEQPLDRLLKAVRSMSPTTLSASIGDIDSIMSMMDTTAGSAPGNGSRAAVGEDLVAMTKWRLQARNMSTQEQDTKIGTRKMRYYTSAMPLNDVSSAGSANYNFKHLTCSETSDSESTSTSGVKRPRFQGLDL